MLMQVTRPAETTAAHDPSVYTRIEKALAIIAENQAEQPSLDDIAAAVGLSPFHFQRLFTKWVGISPKKFLQYLTLDYAKQRLGANAPVLDTAYEVGLSGPSRLHDLFVTHEAVTPGEFKRRGEGLSIRWGFHPTRFGEALLFMTDRGVCGLAFVVNEDRAGAFADMAARWPNAALTEAPEETGAMIARIFERADGGQPVPICLYGTNFQIRVWEALLRIPPGSLVTYGTIAQAIGDPQAARAVGAAVGRNPISWIIPCHRAILGNGYIRNYHWGKARKLAMIGWEAAEREGERRRA